MFFKVSIHDELPLTANDIDLQERWTVVGTGQMEEVAGGKWGWFFYIQNRFGERTKLHLAYDEKVGRVGIAKTVFYRPEDLQSSEGILARRRVLQEQVEILNQVNSPLLPEPLDWFEVTNTVDGLAKEQRDSEPVLVLDYVPGMPLSSYIERQGMRFRSEGAGVDTPRIGRLGISILTFLRILEEQGYAYLDLNPNHVLLLNNDVPRFVGIGSICATRDGGLDPDHVNFGRTSKGYAAPELNDPDANWGEGATPQQIGAFALGVLLHHMVYEGVKFEPGMLKNGSFCYPNGISEEKIQREKDGELIHRLILDLCEHDSEKRLTDFGEIERRLQDIAGAIDSDRFQDKRQELERRRKEREEQKERERMERIKTGRVKFYSVERGFGFIECPDLNTDVYVHANALVKNKIPRLLEGASVRFELRITNENRYQAWNVELLRSQPITMPRSTTTTHKPTPLPKRTTVKKPNDPPPAPPSKPTKKKREWCFLSTAAYGTPTESKLNTLRWFRDDVLRPHRLGRQLLATYARKSPDISRRLEDMPRRKRVVRGVIDAAVRAVRKVQENYGGGIAYWGWTIASVLTYYVAFALAFVLTLPEKWMTRPADGEDE